MKMKKNVLTEEGKGYCDFVFDLSNLNELFEIDILEICLEMFFYFFFFTIFILFSCFFSLIMEYRKRNGIFQRTLRINQDF